MYLRAFSERFNQEGSQRGLSQLKRDGASVGLSPEYRGQGEDRSSPVLSVPASWSAATWEIPAAFAHTMDSAMLFPPRAKINPLSHKLLLLRYLVIVMGKVTHE